MNPAPPVAGDVDLDGLADWICDQVPDWDREELDRAVAGALANHRPKTWIARWLVDLAMDGKTVRAFRDLATETWRDEAQPVDQDRLEAAKARAFAALPATSGAGDPR